MKATHGRRLLVMGVVAVTMMMAVVEASEGKRLHGRWAWWGGRHGWLERLEEMLSAMDDELENEVIEGNEDDSYYNSYYSSPEAARKWAERVDKEMLYWSHKSSEANWNFLTNVTEDTKNKYVAIVDQKSKWSKPTTAEGRKFNTEHFDSDLKRQFQIITMSSSPKDPNKTRQITELHTTMMTTYDTARVCLTDRHHRRRQQQQQHQQLKNDNSSGCLPLEPELQDKMQESRDPAELRELWEGWREVSGKPQRELYAQYVDLLNQGARENGFADYGDYWSQEQFPDDTDLETMTSDLWRQLRPLYLELHAYVRGRLRHHYGSGVVGTDGTIPAHLLGNMWAQTWSDIFSLVIPYPEVSQDSADLDKTLKDQYDVRGLFELAEKFYVSVGLFNMTETFWAKSMTEKPQDREVQCHPSASDMFSPGDFRIKMCTSVTMKYLSTIHHEMGHVQYYMSYQHQPTVFRDSANQAFHEAVGDTTTLSVMSRTHLQELGLASSKKGHDAHKQDINDLLKMALNKIAFPPFALVVDRWRWRVFREQTTPETYNKDWWKLRLELQGLRSPVPRSEEDFDPAAKMHVVNNSPYYCYFISYVVQFQFFKTLCRVSGHQGPLHLCDFGRSVKAGTLFKKFMAVGASQPWQDALEDFTGSRDIIAQPMFEYFEPLRKWLRDENRRNGELVGWEGATINWQH